MGLGFTAVLLLLGGMRELIGNGTLFANIQLLLGEGSRWLTMTVIPNYDGFLLAILPPGAFIGLGLIIAGKNIIDQRLKQRSESAMPQTAQSIYYRLDVRKS
jgi:electron transport complex protein RnfE